MEIDNYRNFLAIVEAGSMTAASEYIHIAQPALSKQVKSLENYFGTKLIITTRGSKHLILTDAGRILYHKAKYICSLEDMAKNEIGDVSDGSKGTLRFTVANSRAAVFIKECLEPFHRLFPLINYEIHEGGITEQSQQLLSGIAELGILSVPPIHQNNFDVLFRRKEKIVCVTAENSIFLKGTTTPTLEELAECPLCLSTGCHLMMSKILSICTTRTTALRWAEDDCGVSIVPMEPKEKLPEGLIAKAITGVDTDLYKTVVRVKGRPLSVVAKKFLQFYSDVRDSERMIKIKDL